MLFYIAVSGKQQKADKFLEKENMHNARSDFPVINTLRFSTPTELCLLQHLH